MKTFVILLSALSLAPLAAMQLGNAADSPRHHLDVVRFHTNPNVVVILADDQGWGDLSVSGNSNLFTPHIDSLARTGAMFDRFC